MSKYVKKEWDENVVKYFKEIVKYQLLTPERELELAIRVRNGDDEAFEELVTSNLRFVISMAKEYQGQGLSLIDLINEGNYGLVKAVSRYDHTKGFRFISYAVWWIKQSIIQSLNDTSRTIRLPTNIINKFFSNKKELDEFKLLNNRNASDGEIMDANGDPIDLLSLPKCSSLNKIINESGDELENLLEDKSNNDDEYYNIDYNVKRELNSLLSTLSIREREIIELYFGIGTGEKGITLEVIGNKYGLTKERIRQIKESAIRKVLNE
jgi:RNA polymerase primary sigma factor